MTLVVLTKDEYWEVCTLCVACWGAELFYICETGKSMSENQTCFLAEMLAFSGLFFVIKMLFDRVNQTRRK